MIRFCSGFSLTSLFSAQRYSTSCKYGFTMDTYSCMYPSRPIPHVLTVSAKSIPFFCDWSSIFSTESFNVSFSFRCRISGWHLLLSPISNKRSSNSPVFTSDSKWTKKPSVPVSPFNLMYMHWYGILSKAWTGTTISLPPFCFMSISCISGVKR